jgi:hypothetical protein
MLTQDNSNYSALRTLVVSFEQVQKLRVQTGERVRATLQGRAANVPSSPGNATDLMARIVHGEVIEGGGPLANLYAALKHQETSLLQAVSDALETHPAWSWLRRVKGVGPSLAGKLLSRLDVERAETPSAFWAFCGLATVPAVVYACDLCGFRMEVAETQSLGGEHSARGTRNRCPAKARRIEGDAVADLRIAQPRPARGERASYSLQAKTLCYLFGVSFLRTRSPYAEVYHRSKDELVRTRPAWSARRRHRTALRKCEKLFLAHLWLVWRDAEGLPIVLPYGWSGDLDAATHAPWAFIEPDVRFATAAD